MTPVHTWPSRPLLPQRRTTWRRLATTLLPVAGCAAVFACRDVEPTAGPYIHSLKAWTDVATAAKPAQALIGSSPSIPMAPASRSSRAAARKSYTPAWKP